MTIGNFIKKHSVTDEEIDILLTYLWAMRLRASKKIMLALMNLP